MSNDFLKELEYLGVTARLKRLSDAFSQQIKELYIDNGFDIEPSWHLIFLILKDRKHSTMTEIAAAFQMSQPAVTKLTRRMIDKGYINVSQDKYDKRKKTLSLSKKAITSLPDFEKVWDAGQKSIREIIKSNINLLDNLTEIESVLQKKSFNKRASEYLIK